MVSEDSSFIEGTLPHHLHDALTAMVNIHIGKGYQVNFVISLGVPCQKSYLCTLLYIRLIVEYLEYYHC
jgi:hypothetical protein